MSVFVGLIPMLTGIVALAKFLHRIFLLVLIKLFILFVGFGALIKKNQRIWQNLKTIHA